jgi:hypothetical protein
VSLLLEGAELCWACLNSSGTTWKVESEAEPEKERSQDTLLSGLRGSPLPLLEDLPDLTARAFQSLLQNGPLTRLDDGDRMFLFVLLKVYEEAKQQGRGDPYLEQMERVAKVAAEAAAFSAKLESEVFQNPYADCLPLYTSRYRELPKQLAEFSMVYGSFMRGFGKSGHKAKILADYYLVEATEFVRLKTGQYCYNEIGVLLNVIGKYRGADEPSGESIRKKRLTLKKHYRQMYDNALTSAKRIYDISARLDSSSTEVASQ